MGTLGACGMSLRFSNSRALEKRTNPHNFGMESPIYQKDKKITRISFRMAIQ